MFDVVAHLFVVLGSLLGLFIVLVLWGIIIFVVVDTIRGIISEVHGRNSEEKGTWYDSL